MLDLEKIKIGWKEYDIRYSDDTIMGETNEERELYGVIDHDYMNIDVTSGYGEEIQGSTLIHEVLHGIDKMYAIDLIESDVTALANGIYTVLKDNNLKIVKEQTNTYGGVDYGNTTHKHK